MSVIIHSVLRGCKCAECVWIRRVKVIRTVLPLPVSVRTPYGTPMKGEITRVYVVHDDVPETQIRIVFEVYFEAFHDQAVFHSEWIDPRGEPCFEEDIVAARLYGFSFTWSQIIEHGYLKTEHRKKGRVTQEARRSTVF